MFQDISFNKTKIACSCVFLIYKPIRNTFVKKK